jgi:hypothetical protein
MTGVILLAPVGILYGWFFCATRMQREGPSWRNRVSVISLSLVSIVAVLWPVTLGLLPRADWGAGVGVDHQMAWVEAWHRPILRTLLVAMILGLFGRARLILPIVAGCVGVGMFWIVSTGPQHVVLWVQQCRGDRESEI